MDRAVFAFLSLLIKLMFVLFQIVMYNSPVQLSGLLDVAELSLKSIILLGVESPIGQT